MKLPIHEKLNNINKAEISLGAFAAISLPIILYPVLGASALVLTTLALPLIASAVVERNALQGKNRFGLNSSWFSSFYKKSFQNWFYNYLRNSESLTEKKYKVLFTAMWGQSNNLKLESLLPKTDMMLDYLESELFQNRETKYFTGYVFYNDSPKGGGVPHDGFKGFIKEDENNSEKIAIARKVYKDFEQLGMLGKNIQSLFNGVTETLLKIQDYKLTKQDFEEIKKYTDQAKNYRNSIASFEINVHNNFEADMKEILFNCETKEEITIIKDLIENVDIQNLSLSGVNKDRLLKQMNEYLANFSLSEKLESLVPEKITKPKMKKKI